MIATLEKASLISRAILSHEKIQLFQFGSNLLGVCVKLIDYFDILDVVIE